MDPDAVKTVEERGLTNRANRPPCTQALNEAEEDE